MPPGLPSPGPGPDDTDLAEAHDVARRPPRSRFPPIAHSHVAWRLLAAPSGRVVGVEPLEKRDRACSTALCEGGFPNPPPRPRNHEGIALPLPLPLISFGSRGSLCCRTELDPGRRRLGERRQGPAARQVPGVGLEAGVPGQPLRLLRLHVAVSSRPSPSPPRGGRLAAARAGKLARRQNAPYQGACHRGLPQGFKGRDSRARRSLGVAVT